MGGPKLRPARAGVKGRFPRPGGPGQVAQAQAQVARAEVAQATTLRLVATSGPRPGIARRSWPERELAPRITAGTPPIPRHHVLAVVAFGQICIVDAAHQAQVLHRRRSAAGPGYDYGETPGGRACGSAGPGRLRTDIGRRHARGRRGASPPGCSATRAPASPSAAASPSPCARSPFVVPSFSRSAFLRAAPASPSPPPRGSARDPRPAPRSASAPATGRACRRIRRWP